MMTYTDYLKHHGIKKMKWGKTNGPPYPLSNEQRSAEENAANPTSKSARMLARQGDNNRFVKADRSGSINRSNSSSEKNQNGNSGKPKTYSSDLTKDRAEKFASKYADARAKNLASQASAAEQKQSEKKTSSKSSSSSSSKKSDAQKAAEKAAKEAEKARKEAEKAAKEKEKAEEKEREKWISDSKKAITDAFNGNMSFNDFRALIDEITGGKMSLDKMVDDKEKMEREAIDDPKDLEDLEEDTYEAIGRFAKSISKLADYVYKEFKENPSKENEARNKVMQFFESKVDWWSKTGSNSSSGKQTLKEAYTIERIEEWLRKNGF